MKNQLLIGDNLPIMLNMPDELADLIYLDPPFNSRTFRRGKTEKHSFNDTWTKREIDARDAIYLRSDWPVLWSVIDLAAAAHGKAMHSYLEFMASRLVQIHKLLKPTGSVYLHCDPSANYYLRLLMDCIFGAKNYRNEIVWGYKASNSPVNRKFHSKHDTILFYAKSEHNLFNHQFTEYDPEYVKKTYRHKDEDGRLYRKHSKRADGTVRKLYLDEGKGTPVISWWTDIKGFGTATRSKEWTGYATQKPLKLLRRIIAASSNEGDIVLDPFCGCATACVAANGMHRKWIGIDQNKLALKLLQERLADTTIHYETNQPADAKLIKPVRPKLNKKVFPDAMSPAQAKPILVRRDVRAFGYTICKGCLDKHDVTGKNLTVDHKVAKDVGGPDRLKNYQLMCTPCNSKKGNKPMEYLHELLAKETAQERLEIQRRLEKSAAYDGV